jgi:hypothetical protein
MQRCREGSHQGQPRKERQQSMSKMLAQAIYDIAREKFATHQREAKHSCRSVWCDECNALGYIAQQAACAVNHNPDYPEAM